MPEEDGLSFKRIVVWDARTGKVIGEVDRDGVDGVEIQAPDVQWPPMPPLDFSASIDYTFDGLMMLNALLERASGRTRTRFARARSLHRARRGRTRR